MSNDRKLEREANTCVHFRGIQHDTCKAGCLMDAFPIVVGQGRPLPCLPPFRPRPDDAPRPTCAKFEAIGMARALELEKESNAAGARITAARAAIIIHAGGRCGVRGQFTCPVCNTGTLGYTIAGCNGHVHAKCSTVGCVSWME